MAEEPGWGGLEEQDMPLHLCLGRGEFLVTAKEATALKCDSN